MDYMNLDMVNNQVLNIMLNVLKLVHDLSKKIEHIYCEKEMDDDANEEMMSEI